ncbi:MAG: DUF6169 family protein [Bacteroidia bacterium]
MQDHYNYSFDNITNTYNFSTKNNILYRVAFVVDETFATISNKKVENIYQLIIEKATNEIEPYDSFVWKTIEKIIEKFFINSQNSLIYFCSDEKNKAEKRFKIFHRWYLKSKYKNLISKIDNTVEYSINEIEVMKIFTSFLFHNDNPNKTFLINTFNKIEDYLNEEK